MGYTPYIMIHCALYVRVYKIPKISLYHFCQHFRSQIHHKEVFKRKATARLILNSFIWWDIFFADGWQWSRRRRNTHSFYREMLRHLIYRQKFTYICTNIIRIENSSANLHFRMTRPVSHAEIKAISLRMMNFWYGFTINRRKCAISQQNMRLLWPRFIYLSITADWLFSFFWDILFFIHSPIICLSSFLIQMSKPRVTAKILSPTPRPSAAASA